MPTRNSKLGSLVWIDRLRDPKTGAPLVRYVDTLRSYSGGEYPIAEGIPDFLSRDDEAIDQCTAANIGYYEKEDRKRYELMWSQYVDDCSYKRIRRILEDYAQIELKNGTVYLDLGCGFGYFVLNLLSAEEIIEHHAIDVHFNGLLSVLNRAVHTGRYVQAVRGSVYELPYATESFDLITANGVLHHLAEANKASVQIASKLAPDGYGVFIEPTVMWKWTHKLGPLFLMRSCCHMLTGIFTKRSGQTDSLRSHGKASKEPDNMSVSDWVSAFRDAGLEVRVTQFHFLAGFFRSWIVAELMRSRELWPIAGLLYRGVRIAELLDHWLLRHPSRGFYHLITVHKLA